MVIAPAGFGKSEAIRSSFAPTTPTISIPNHPNVESVASAIATALFPEEIGSLGDALRVTNANERNDAITTWLTKHILATGPQSIIVEDVERLNGQDSAEARALLESVIENSLGIIHWIIGSREYPQFASTTIWLTRGMMHMPVSASDLRFTSDEAFKLAQSLGLDATRERINAIVEQTEGWPLIVRLIYVAMAQGGDLRPVDLAFDYIANQIWDRTNGQLRAMLIAAAFVPELTPSVVHAVIPTAPMNALGELVRSLPLLEQTQTGGYRLHDLLREFVIQRHADSPEVAAIGEALTAYYIAHGEHLSALAVFRTVGNAEATHALLLNEGARLIEDGHRTSITNTIAHLPPELQQDANMTALRGLIALNSGEDDLGISLIEDGFKRGITDAIEATCRLRMYRVYRFQHDLSWQTKVIEPLAEHTDRNVRAKAFARLALTRGLASENDAEPRYIAEAERLLPNVDIETQADVYASLARVHYYLGHFEQAGALAERARRLASEIGNNYLASISVGILIGLLTENPIEADVLLELIDELDRVIAASYNPVLATHVIIYRIHFHLSCGNAEEVIRLYMTAPAEVKSYPSAINAMGTALILQGRFQEAIHYSSRAEHAPTSSGNIADNTMTVRAILALAYALDNQYREASAIINDLEAARITSSKDTFRPHASRAERAFYLGCAALHMKKYHIAERLLAIDATEEHLYQYVCEVAARVVRLASTGLTATNLEATLRPLKGTTVEGYAQILRAVVQPAEVRRPIPSELRILRELQHGATSGEIASRLGLSPKTVDNTINKLMAKLGCSKRSLVVKIAEEEGWLEAALPVRLSR
jgi:ATP/maltotriose-dependent transcriptional regulator MalT